MQQRGLKKPLSFFSYTPNSLNTIAVIGAGSWATALTKIVSESGLGVRWWFHRQEDANHFSKYFHNPRYLSDIDFSGKSVNAFTNLVETLAPADLVLIAVPSAYVELVLTDLPSTAFKNKKIISSIKGIMPGRLELVTQYLNRQFQVPELEMAVIGGPCHAEEVALEKQSYLTIASPDLDLAKRIKELIESRYISVATTADMDGLEWSAVLKNVYAIACGVCHGVGFGDNFQAVLVANAMQEMDRFLKSYASCERDTLASAYLGDLLVTAYSTFSRNRTFGNMVGRGYSIKAAQVELGMVAEGYFAIQGLHQLREKLSLHLPIAESMYSIMYNHAPVKETIDNLRKILN